MRSILCAMGLALVACAGGMQTVREQAAKDMACPANQLVLTSTNTSRPDDDRSDTYYAQGCDKLRRYYVQCANDGTLCHSPESFDVLAMVQKQASFDLRCEPSAIAISHLNIDTFGVRGCDKQLSYQMLCELGSCQLRQNSTMQNIGDPASAAPAS